MAKAVFLDRDGVINANVFYADTGEVEAPRTAADFTLLPGVLEAMQRLQSAGYLLFLVSNQPNQAKRKATAADHDAIQVKLKAALDEGELVLHSRDTVGELLRYVHLPGGGAGAEGSGHDDRVMSLAIAVAMAAVRPRTRSMLEALRQRYAATGPSAG